MSRSRDSDEVRHLFSEHVPEIASGVVAIVAIVAIARETGRGAMIVVYTSDVGVCPVGSCFGPRGERLKTVMRGLPSDMIDIIRWSDSEQDFIRNVLAPARVEQITFDATARREGARVWFGFVGGRAHGADRVSADAVKFLDAH